MVRASAPARALAEADTELAEVFLSRDLTASWETAEATEATAEQFAIFVLPTSCAPPLEAFFLSFAAPFALSAAKALGFESARAIASASHAAFTLPRVAGRLLDHSAEPASPAICAMVRSVKIDVSYFSLLISNPATTK